MANDCHGCVKLVLLIYFHSFVNILNSILLIFSVILSFSNFASFLSFSFNVFIHVFFNVFIVYFSTSSLF